MSAVVDGIAAAGDWDTRVRLIRRIPELFGTAEHAGIYIALFHEWRRQDEAAKVFTEVGSLWMSSRGFSSIRVDCKFAYGKHGEGELRRLFATIGIEDVFQVVQIASAEESLAGSNRVDGRGVINSITNIRNNILHQDASPGFTVEDVNRYAGRLRGFADSLARLLGQRLDELRLKCVEAST